MTTPRRDLSAKVTVLERLEPRTLLTAELPCATAAPMALGEVVYGPFVDIAFGPDGAMPTIISVD